MTIYSFHIFDRHCDCIFHTNYYNQHQTAPVTPQTGTAPLDTTELNQLIYGVIYSARNLVNKLRNGPVFNSDNSPFFGYATSHYKLHYFETPTSLKLVLITSTNMESKLVRNALRSIYRVYVEHVVKNPLAHLTKGPILVKLKKNKEPAPLIPAAYITNDAFKLHLDQIILSLSSPQ